jgi:hypothetical protein
MVELGEFFFLGCSTITTAHKAGNEPQDEKEGKNDQMGIKLIGAWVFAF